MWTTCQQTLWRVVPVVEDVLQHIGVTAPGDCLVRPPRSVKKDLNRLRRIFWASVDSSRG